MPYTAVVTNGRYIATESITLANADDVFSSKINWVKPHSIITLIVNEAALNTVGAVSVDLEYSNDDGATWFLLDGSYIAAIDTLRVIKILDPDVVGIFTAYRLKFTSVADDSASVITFVVISDPLDKVFKPKS